LRFIAAFRMIIFGYYEGGSLSNVERLKGGNLMPERKEVEAFILINREALTPEVKPQKQTQYDDKLQIWVD